MSVQAGVWCLDGRPVDTEFLDRMSAILAERGPDGNQREVHGSIGFLYRPFHTTPQSRLESQPHTFGRGKLMMWDGRLDNRGQLISELGLLMRADRTDLEIVAAAFEKWGTRSFKKLIGDWALTVWDPAEKSVFLARDYSAVRNLYYYGTRESVMWCTELSAIVLLSGIQFTVDDEYIAGFLIAHPDADLTPYREVRAVPPGSYVKIHQGRVTAHPYWKFEPQKLIKYKSDADYEHHYLYLFQQAIRRRLRSDCPILAELSGGLDSSSIVCVADDILQKEGLRTPRLDTFSYYDINEPAGDDFFYLTKIEEKRGRKGLHLDTSKFDAPYCLEYPRFAPIPLPDRPDDMKTAQEQMFREGGYRVGLSGTGGDEINGMASDPRVMMGDLLAQFRLGEFAKQLKAWSLYMKRPWIHLFLQTCRLFFPISLQSKMTKHARPEPWFDPKFVRQYRMAERKLGGIQKRWFRLPSMQDWDITLATLARQMGEHRPSILEMTYPYLDRDLVDFLTSVPQDQFLRPGERRSLMRRALANILPSEVRLRKTKAGAARCHIVLIEKNWNMLQNVFASPMIGRRGYVNPAKYRKALEEMKSGNMSIDFVDFMRAMTLEFWLRDMARSELVTSPPLEATEPKMNLAHSPA